tara:strand:+ start:681 stop:1232 length:552 start_codon:yes stop_codon:yes gene_type:complete
MKNNLHLKIKKLALFFEINRLDRGLFRFWILGTGLFYFFVLILIFSGEITQFNYLKKRLSQNMSCATSSLFPDLSYRNIYSNKKVYVGPNKYLIITAVEDGIKVLDKSDTYFGSSENGTYVGGTLSKYILFNKKENCEKYISKSIMLFEFILIFAWLLLLPLFAVPTWLIGKKTVLWLIRGFK